MAVHSDVDSLEDRIGEPVDLFPIRSAQGLSDFGNGPVSGLLDSVSRYGVFIRWFEGDLARRGTVTFYPWSGVAGLTFAGGPWESPRRSDAP